MSLKLNASNHHPESTISVTCSCFNCESLCCFAKRGNNHHFTCPICNKPRTCLYHNDHREGRRNVSDDITAPYFNSAKRKANRDFEEFTENEVNYESERKILLEINQPPHSLDEYLDRLLCVNKATCKLKQTPPSLSEYIDIISQNKRNLNTLKQYVQSLKETKPLNPSEDLINSETFMDSLYPQQWDNRLPEISGQHSKKGKCKCHPICLAKQKPSCQHVTQIHNAMISYPLMNYKHESASLNTHPESTISVNCSCSHSESLSCFVKRGNNHDFTCPICNKPRTCLYHNDHREGRRNVSDDITAPYFNSAKPKANRDFEELPENEINYESERKFLLEINQTPPDSLDNYLDRFLCVNKVTSKLKQTPPSLSEYIDIISEKAAYNRNLNILKEYVQSLKEAKPLNPPEDLTNSETFMDSLYPQQWDNRLPKISGQHRRKGKCKCQPICLAKQKPSCQHVTQIHNAMISYPIMNYKHESAGLNTYPESTISMNCSCAHSSCFTKKGNNHSFTCPICNKPTTCTYHNDHREGSRNISDDRAAPYFNAEKPKANREYKELTEDEINYESERKILMETNQPPPHSLDEYLHRSLCVNNISDDRVAPYFNAEKPKANREYKELTEDEINYESERKILMETNQPPPHSLDEYLHRLLCVNKASSKFKQTPPSLSGYIDIISENAAYKRNLNTLKEYVQSLKEAKPSNRSEDLTNSETFKNSLYTQQWNNRLREISDQPKKKDKCECQTKCLVNQIQNAMISSPIINYKHESAKLNTQASNVIYENYKEPCKTSASNENNIFKYDIFKKLKEAYIACSCKVCECITPKLMNNDICKCKPCQCAECKGYAAAQSNSRVPTVPYICNVCNDHSALKTQKECACVPCECEICHMNNAAKYSDVPKPFLTRQPSVVTSVTRTVCTCLPCDCSLCLESDTVVQTFSNDKYKCLEKCISNFDHSTASINEIYRQKDNKNKNIKQNFVALCTGMPRWNTNRDLETRHPKTCICKECECITCVCKEKTINAIKSSGFFSTIDESAHLLKSNSGNNHYYENRPYRVCKACSRNRDLLHRSTDKWDKHASYYTGDECIRLSEGPINQKNHLNRCRCTNCRCERCIAHGFDFNYPSTVGVCPIKKGDVLSPSDHQSKIQKLKLEEKAAPTTLFHKCELSYKNINSYINPQMENINYRGISKNIYPKDVTSRPSVSRQAKRDMGTMLSKSFNRWKVLKCDAYVHSQEFNRTKPLLKNSFTTSRSRSSIYSITGSSSQKNDNGTFISEDKTKSLKLFCHSSRQDNSNYLIRLPKLEIKKIAYASKLDVPNDLKLSTVKSSTENIILEKQENKQSPHNILPKVTSSKDNGSENTNGSYSNGQVLNDEIGKYKTNNCFLQPSNNIFTEITSSNKVNDCKNKVCYSHAQVQPKESGRHKTNVNSNGEIVSTSYQPLKSLSTSAITTLESLIILNSNNKSSKAANNNGNNFNCFRVLQNLKQSNLISNIYNHYNSPKVKIRDLMTNSNLLDIKNDNEKARRTLEDAKKFSLHLLSLLEMYEKANNDFVKISDILKTSYTSLLDRKLSQNKRQNFNQLENFQVNSKSNSSFEEITTHTLNTIAKRLSDSRITSQKSELSHVNECTSNQESSNTDFQILKTISNAENKEVHKKCERICYANVQNERSKRNFKKKINPEYDRKLHYNESRTAAATHYADLKQDDFEPLNKSIEHLSRSTSTDTTKNDIFSPTMKKEVKTEPGPACRKRFGFTAKPNIISKRAGISGIPSLQVDTQKTIIPQSVLNNTTHTINKEKSRHEKEAIQQVSKILELAILEPLNYVDDTEDNLLESLSVSDQSILNLDIKEQPIANKSMNQRPKQVDKEVWCSDQKLLDDLKKEIREQLKVTCMHPLMSKASSLGSHSCNSECEDLKARFLVVRKISEHTALLRWSQPRGLGVQGYEVLVDGRTVQKILNPSKCLTAVTCLPHTDKIILTIRTITSFKPEVGHYPTTTKIYWPHQQ